MAPPNSNHWITDPEYIDLLKFIIERAGNVESPLNIRSLAREFKEKSGSVQLVGCLSFRIQALRTWIQNSKHIDTNTKVKVLFALSAGVHIYFLRELRKNAFVQVDEKNRIVYYKAINGSLKLRGDHSMSKKLKTAQLESKRSLRSWIIEYFENKNNADTVSKNEEMRETGKLIKFLTDKCENVNSPLGINRVAKNFIQHFGVSEQLDTICYRAKAYSREIQTLEFLDTPSKVKQLFVLSETLNSEFLKELRKDASVEVDHKNRIIKYMSNDGSLTLRGCHWGSRITEPRRIRKKKVKGVVKLSDYEGLDDGNDEYSSEELNSELDTDDKTGNIEMSIEDGFEYDPPSPATPKSTKRNTNTTESSTSKRTRPSADDLRTPDEWDDYDRNYSIDDQVKLEPFCGEIQEYFKEIKGDEDIQQIPKPLQAHDEHNQIEEVLIKVEPEELKIVENPQEDVKPEIAQAHDEHNELIEVPIKLEHEEPVEVKPEMAHNPKIKFFEAMQSLILCLDTPCLSWIQSKIHQKIQELEGSDEVILNVKMISAMELLIDQMTSHSVMNISEMVESVSLIQFLCYLKAAILNSRLTGLDPLLEKIKSLNEDLDLQIKRVPVETLVEALQVTMDIIGI